MSLREIQELFWRAITWPTGVEAFLAEADADTRARFEQVFGETRTFDRTQRVEVYAEAYFWRQHDVLRDGFEALAGALGPARFRNLVTDYLLAHPSTQPSLRHLGDRLVDYLAGHAVGREQPWLVELARLEHWRYRLLDRADVEAVPASALAGIAPARWPALRFRMADTARVLRGHYDVHALWERARDCDEVPGTPAGGPEHTFFVLVWRRGFAVVHRPLAHAEGEALSSLAAGGTFTQIATHAERDADGRADPRQVVAWLSGWLTAGLIAEVIDGA